MPTISDPGAGRGLSPAAWAVLAALLSASIGALWTIDYLPTHDGPQHIFTIHAANHLDDVANGYSRYLGAGRNITSHGFAVLFGPLDAWLPWRVAYRIALTGMVALWIGGCVVLAFALHPKRVWLGLALAGAGFRWSLYMGLFNFYIATSFGLWILAFATSRTRWGVRERALLGALLLIQSLMHAVPALATAGIVSLLLISRAPPGRRVSEALTCIASAAPVLAIVGFLLVGAADQAGYQYATGETARRFAYQQPPLWTLAKCFTGGPGWRAWPLTLLAALAPLAAYRLKGRELAQRDRVLLGVGVLSLVAAGVLPLHLPVWDYFSVRLLPFAILCALLAIPLESLPAGLPRRLVAAGLSLFALASAGWAITYNRDLAARSEAALAGLDLDLRRSGPRIAIVMDPFAGRPVENRDAAIPFAVPLLNLGQLYATEQGGVAADTFAISPPTHAVLFREDAPPFPPYPDRSYSLALLREENRDDPEYRHKLLSFVATYTARFEDVILWGEEEDAELLIERGFVSDHRADGLMLAHFEGCPLSLEVETRAGLPASDRPDAVELGWYPLLGTTSRFALATLPRSGSRLEVPGAPCGPVWLRVGAAAPGAPPPGLACRGADSDGRLILADTRQTPVVRCEWIGPQTELSAATP